MKIVLLQIDKTQDSYISEGSDIYVRRLQHYTSFEYRTIQVPKQIRMKSVAEQKSEEAKLILAELNTDDQLVLLDERGKEMSSVVFSKFIAQKQNSATKRLTFLIGGPFGFDQKIYQRANAQLSLSQMTFSHQMIRLFFLEQLYRAFSILKGEKYHHE